MAEPIELTAEQRRRLKMLIKEPPPRKLYTLSELAERGGCTLRNAQYLFEHQLFPAELASQFDQRSGQGKRHEYSAISGLYIVLGARMLDAGYRRGLVDRIMRGLMRWVQLQFGYEKATNLLRSFLLWHFIDRLEIEIADGRFLRVTHLDTGSSTGWHPLEEHDEGPENWYPVLITRFNLQGVKEKLS